MTVNNEIAVTNIAVAVSLILLGSAFLWKARAHWREWPVAALIAIGGWVLSLACIMAQLAWWRLAEPDPEPPWHTNGLATLTVRVVAVVLTLALLRRVMMGTLLTAADRRRLGAG
jgi:hypothetical protein